MTHRRLTIAYLLFYAGIAQADPVHGLWQTQPGDSGGVLHVELNACDTKTCGTIVRAIDKDGRVSDSYEHLGKRMIWDMQPKGDGQYSQGKIWAPDKDKTYKSKMHINGDTLTVKGCVAGGWICRGQDWQRVRD